MRNEEDTSEWTPRELRHWVAREAHNANCTLNALLENESAFREAVEREQRED